MHALKSLSDRELVARLRSLVEKEKSFTLEIVSHLVEIARRGLHLGKGYGSLYEYCRGELGYTDASAWRRARAAQAILRCPEAWERLANGRVTLCTLGRVYKFITPMVLEEICGRSKTEVEWVAARYDAKGVSPDRMRPVMVPKPAAGPAAASTSAGEALAIGEISDRLRSEVTAPGADNGLSLRGEVPAASHETLTPLRGEVATGHGERRERLEFERKWRIEAVISDRVKAKLDRCKSLLSSKYPRGVDYDILFGELADVFLGRMDPERKEELRKQRRANEKRPAKAASTAPSNASRSRYIPEREKEAVCMRDKGRCAYVGPNGKRCDSTFGLQIDHFPIPFARGGPSKASNLRLLCARHNRCTAERAFGCLPHGKHGKPAGAGVSNRLIPGSAKALIPNTSP